MEIVILNKKKYKDIFGRPLDCALRFNAKHWRCVSGDNFLYVHLDGEVASMSCAETEYEAQTTIIPVISTVDKEDKLGFYELIQIMNWKVKDGQLWDY